MKLRLRTASRFNRDARLLLAVSGSSAVSFYGIHTLLRVLYVLRLGYGPEYVGLFSAAGALTYMGMGLPSGALGSRLGTKTVMLAGGLITVLGMAIMPLAEFVPLAARDAWPIASQVVLILGWSMFNVNLVPALKVVTAEESASSAYAISGVLRGLGTFVGTLTGGVLPGLFATLLGQPLDAPAPYRMALWVGAAAGLAAVLPLICVRQGARVIARERTGAGERVPVLPLALMIAYVYLNQAGWATTQAFGNAYMDVDLRLTVSSIGLINSVGQFIAILAPLLTPRLAARHSNGWTLMMTTLGMAVSLVPLALIPHWAAAGLGRLGIVVLSAIWMPALQVFQMELVDPRWRSLAYGAVSMAMGLGFGSVSLAGGYLIAAQGYRTLFLIGVGLSTAGAALMWRVLKRPALLQHPG